MKSRCKLTKLVHLLLINYNMDCKLSTITVNQCISANNTPMIISPSSHIRITTSIYEPPHDPHISI